MIGLTNPTHIVLLLLIALLLFGAKRLPEMGRSLGHGMREFKDSVSNIGSDEHDHHAPTPSLPAATEEPVRLTTARDEHEREVV